MTRVTVSKSPHDSEELRRRAGEKSERWRRSSTTSEIVADRNAGGRMFNFLRMWQRGVDPFAIKRAQRRLDEAGISLDESTLESHYLDAGQLESLVTRLLANSKSAEPQPTGDIRGRDLAEADLSAAQNPKLVNPLGWGAVYSAAAVLVVSLLSLPLLFRFRGFAGPVLVQTAAGLILLIILSSFSLALLGSRIGRKRANQILTGIAALLLIAMIVWLRFAVQ